MTTPAQEPTYCSDLSLQAGEPLYGTATQTDVYLLLEYNGAWGPKALEESAIPDSVKAYLKTYGKANPLTKTLVIRAPRQQQAPDIRFFVALAGAVSPAIYIFHLERYEDLLKVDIPAVLAGDPRYAVNRYPYPLYLVCTNGRRDACCARHGPAVLDALFDGLPDNREPLIWHSTHMGGHRFAANMICLPHGLLYGRVRADTARLILAAYQRGDLYLPNLRGRACYPPPAQAAEVYLRQGSGEIALDAYRLLDAQAVLDGEWLVRFYAHKDSTQVDVALRVEKSETQVFDSCMLDKRTPITVYTPLVAR
jgi:hypothetical protein